MCYSVKFPYSIQPDFQSGIDLLSRQSLLVAFYNHLNLDGNIEGQNGRSYSGASMATLIHCISGYYNLKTTPAKKYVTHRYL